MINHTLEKQFSEEQYKKQANSVYINTMIISGILSIFSFIFIKSMMLSVVGFFAIMFCILAIYLNRSSQYGLSSLIYIGYISAATFLEICILGFDSGFQYMFFSLVGLIMFTNWKAWQKFFGVVLEIILVVTAFLLTYDKTPLIQLSYEMTSFFHIGNLFLNIIGVSYSAYHYVFIATNAFAKISKLAMKDYLTGLMNRTSFDDYLQDVLEVRKDNRENLAILMMDIDHFKRINDTCGHLCGDEILKEVAVILTKNIFKNDCVARFGGEEFIIIVQIDELEEMLNFAERLRHDIEAKKFEFALKENYITISIGALFIPYNVIVDKNEVLTYVDKLLYRAKAEGRNRVVSNILEN